MAANSKIEWTECTWNPVTGCTKISPGCLNCYAERMARRLRAMGQPNYRNGFRLTVHPHMLELPLHWRQPRSIFVNSMSDLFHKDVPLEFIRQVFDMMRRAPQHRFQILTKRSERLKELSPRLAWPDNVWMGVTVENSDHTFRIEHLRQTSAARECNESCRSRQTCPHAGGETPRDRRSRDAQRVQLPRGKGSPPAARRRSDSR